MGSNDAPANDAPANDAPANDEPDDDTVEQYERALDASVEAAKRGGFKAAAGSLNPLPDSVDVNDN